MTKIKLVTNSIISLIIVISSLYIFINNSNGEVDFNNLITNIYSNLILLFLASFLLVVSVLLRAIRWKFLLNVDINIMNLFSAQLIGYFVNNILPIRIGDIIKSYVIAKKTNNSTGYVIGSVFVERVLDTITLLFFSTFLFYYLGSTYFDTININFYNISIFLIFTISFYFLFKFYLQKFIPKIIINFFKEMKKGIYQIKHTNIAIIIISSILIWLIYLTNVYLIQKIFEEFELSFMQCLLLLFVSSFIQMIPSGFGALGIFQLGAESVLMRLEVLSYHNFLFLLWLYSFINYTLLGAFYFIKECNFTLKKIYSDITKFY